jgi:tellurite resistance protein TerC
MIDAMSCLSAAALPVSQAAETSGVFWLYAAFVGLVCVFLALDLGVFHREAHEVKVKEALIWTVIWVACAMAFNVGVYFIYENHVLGIGRAVQQLGGAARDVGGAEAAKLFFTGYVVEKSLSMDNVFVIAMIFSFFAVPPIYQHRVLFWGILGALLMRGAMIGVGAALIAKFTWIVYIFGGFLILSALKMAVIKGEHVDPNKNPAVRLVRRLIPISPHYDGQKFFTRFEGKRAATPLFLALVLVEFTDLIFAVDSIPAIFAITADPFLVFTSNVFAILGLRALYFCLASMMSTFRFLKPALILVLAFVGVKMLLVHTEYKVPTTASLLVILGVLGVSVLASWLIPAKPGDEKKLPGPEGILDPAASFRKKKPSDPPPAAPPAE